LTKKMQIRTLKDLAKLADVSTGTVSRALADSELISKKTRTRIQELAQKHGFQPNITARNLRTQRTGAIGVTIPLGHEKGQHVSDPFFITMLGLLADALTERGYDLMLSRVIPADSGWLDKIVDSGRIDGLIVIGQSDQSITLDKVSARYRPMVVWGGYEKNQKHCSVGTDNFKGGRLAAEHLIERGCERIAFFGDPSVRELSQRYDGCRAAMAKAGFEKNLTVVPTHLVAETADPDISAFLSGAREKPQGIFAASDVIAMSALRALSDYGLAVPADVKVVGFDGLALSEHTVPRLTTVRQDLTAGAAHLVDLLLRRIAGEETGNIVMDPELIVRMST